MDASEYLIDSNLSVEKMKISFKVGPASVLLILVFYKAGLRRSESYQIFVFKVVKFVASELGTIRNGANFMNLCL